MFKVCALMAIYNEEDILRESLELLIADGIDVYIIDNGSTDSSLKIANDFYGKGVIGIEVVKHTEFGKEVYNWTKILERKQKISFEMDYQWFLHVDADEVRCSPWSGMTLSQGIEFVDCLGFNLINFKLFNFKMTAKQVDMDNSRGVVDNMHHYANTEKYNAMQVKAWKKNIDIDLVSHGGHMVVVKNPEIFPVRFILKHYPLRSRSQAIKKINAERKNRFSLQDKSKGWHVQYDSIPVDTGGLIKNVFIDESKLIKFNFEYECSLVQREGFIAQFYKSEIMSKLNFCDKENFWKSFILQLYGLDLDNVDGITDFSNEVQSRVTNNGFFENDYDEVPEDLRRIIFSMMFYRAIDQYLVGNPFLFDAIPKNFLFKCIGNDLARLNGKKMF